MSTHSIIPASGQAEIIIPHGNLVLVADYTRDGNDLILTGPDGTVVAVTGYFSGALLPSLVSAQGAAISGDIIARLAGEEPPARPGQDEPIGVVGEVEGMVTATPPGGVAVELAAGDPVYQNWLIETDGAGSAGITLNDGTKIGLSHDGRLLLDEFVFDSTTEAGSSVLTVLKGVFAAVTGRLGETSPDNVQIQTLNGTIGIRGTTFVIEVGEIGEVEFTVMEGRIVVTLPDGRVFELSQPGDSLSVGNTGETVLCEGSGESLEQMNSDPAVREALARAQALAGDIPGAGADGDADGTGGGGEASCVRFISGAETGFQIDLTPVDGLSVQAFRVEPEALGDQPGSAPQDTGADRRGDVNAAPKYGALSYELPLDENLDGSEMGVALGMEPASDPNPGDTVRYAIVSGNDEGLFRIDELTGELEYVGAGENFERRPSHELTVRASDDHGLSTEVGVTISITDLPESPPGFNPRDYTFSMAENQDGSGATGVALGTVSARDPDEGAAVRYTIVSGNDAGLFRIGTTSGVLEYVGAGENYESGTTSHALTVRATDAEGLTTNPDATVTVNVTDVNEGPEFGESSYTFDLAENRDGSGTAIAFDRPVTATDPEGHTPVSYSIAEGNTDLFQIDAQSGELKYVGDGENFEGGTTRHELTVRATDASTPQGKSADIGVTINITDVNEAPVFDMANYPPFDLLENTPAIALGPVTASDPDAGDTVSYSIESVSNNGEDLFRIDELTGELKYVGDGEDFESWSPPPLLPSYDLTVRATDADGLSANATVTVNIANDDEEPPRFVEDSYEFKFFGKWEDNPSYQDPYTLYIIYLDPEKKVEYDQHAERQITRADDENIIWYFLDPPISQRNVDLISMVVDDDPDQDHTNQPLTFNITNVTNVTNKNDVSGDGYFEIDEQGVLRYTDNLTDNLPLDQSAVTYKMTVTVANADKPDETDSVELTIEVDRTRTGSEGRPSQSELREGEVVPAPLLSDGYTATPAPDAQPALGASAIEMV